MLRAIAVTSPPHISSEKDHHMSKKFLKKRQAEIIHAIIFVAKAVYIQFVSATRSKFRSLNLRVFMPQTSIYLRGR